jgi:hypothetical protein
VLIFIDESGDLGFRFDRGSTRYFTIALVIFETDEAALSCQRAIEACRRRLRLANDFEFHFHSDRHVRRIAFLDTIRDQSFRLSTFTLDKPKLWNESMRNAGQAYRLACEKALDDIRIDLDGMQLVNAHVVIDGSGDRRFRRQLTTFIKQAVNRRAVHGIRSVRLSRSESDPLVQLADYVAGVTNRQLTDKDGTSLYESRLQAKRRSFKIWP